MDGFELARRVHMHAGHETLKLVALTGYGQEGDRRAARAAGFADLLVKPTSLEQLDATIRELSPTGAPKRSASRASGAGS